MTDATLSDDERAEIDRVLSESWERYEDEYRDDDLDGTVVHEDDEVVVVDFSRSDDRDIVYDELEVDIPYRAFAVEMSGRARDVGPDRHWMYPLVFPAEVQD